MAVVIGAAIAASAAVTGAVVNKSASDKAASASANAAKNSRTMQLHIYESNKAALQPYMDRGNAAGSALNGLLGLGGDQAASEKAWAQFKNSTGYQSRLQQGMDSITQNKAVSGLLKSGSALKALDRFGQDYASNELGNYMGQLGQQQGAGLSASNALAGVGTGYANAVSALNMNNAANQGNAALANANNTNALISNLANAFGQMQSSYQQPQGTTGYNGNGIGSSGGGNYGSAFGRTVR